MKSQPRDSAPKVACLSYFGRDCDGLLELVFNAAGTGPRGNEEPDLNLEQFSALTLLGRAGILAELVGSSRSLGAAKLRLEAMALKRGDYCSVQIIPFDEHAPTAMQEYQPFPWRLQVTAPDERGILTSLCTFLYERGIKVTACRGELYVPRLSPVTAKSACDLRLTVLLPRTINRAGLELDLDIRSKRLGWLEWSMQPLK